MKTMTGFSIYKNENRFLHLKVIFKISLLKVDIWKEMTNIIISSEYNKDCRRNNWNIVEYIL